MEVDWDLHAVVRGCTSSANTAVTTTTTSFNGDLALETPPQQIQSWFSSSVSSFGTGEQSSNNGHLFTLDDPFEARTATEELHELYKPFFPKSPHHLHQPPINSPRSILTSQQQPFSSSISSITCSSSKDQTPLKHQQQQRPSKQSHHASSASSSTTRTKRRKNQLKRVCHVPAEGLSSDVWAWRKYGQKPIKGSPFPRGYYRCSSSKGCLARKQVERNRSDPGMFIVTFTAEHNHPAPTHRNSLAGSTRQKPLTPQTVTGGGSESNKPSSPSSSTKPTFSSPSPTTSMEEEAVPQSGNTESRELDLLEEEEENGLAVSDIGISDDFFSGLEGLGSGNSLPDHFPASFGLPWAAENAATAAGGI